VSVGQNNILGFQLKQKLGSGARTTIHHVTDRAGRSFALKHLNLMSASDRRFLVQMRHEHSIAKRLNFPGIRRTHRLKLRRRPFRVVEAGLVMDYIEGTSLDQADSTGLPRTVESFRQIAEALASLHRLDWVHADVKPTNIIVSPAGAVLIDLGQAAKTRTTKSRVQGTPGFMAPEQAYRDPITPRTDLYGFGATFYWSLTGKTVPTVINSRRAGQRVVNTANLDQAARPTPVQSFRSDVPEELSKLIDQCVSPNPSARPRGMPEILGVLARIKSEIMRASDD
jgi:serine/threonine-protein kinase